MDLDSVRTCAILHDIGKPASWFLGHPWSQHIYHTYDIVRETLGEGLAEVAIRHHTGSTYPEKYRPRRVEERIICLADNLSSGADRRELPERGDTRPHPPFRLTHPLSMGDKDMFRLDGEELHKCSQRIAGSLSKAAEGFERSHREGYLRIYRVLEDSDLNSIPADTRPPINDVSLWHHSKLTAAFTTCILMDGGWKGMKASDYSFSLLSGDGDRISSFIQESVRVPDLNARSMKVREATNIVVKEVSSEIGPECVLFAGGGSLLVLSPQSKLDELESKIPEVFWEAMDGEVSFTMSSIDVPGNQLQQAFGKAWERAAASLRRAKLEKTIYVTVPLEPDTVVCDICRKRKGVHRDDQRVVSDKGEPRPEMLCENCWTLREYGHGVWLKDISGGSGYVALIKADGDDVGSVFSGETLDQLDKSVTPSRLASLSSLINRTCEMLERVVSSHGGRTVYAGGDDILAILPGDRALDAALELRQRFYQEMNGRCTLSAGVAVFSDRLPIYTGLEQAYRLLEVAKERAGKDSVAYSIISGVGYQKEAEALRWSSLDRTLEILKFLEESGFPNTQVRRIVIESKKNPLRAEALIKYLMGREVIPWDKGRELLTALESGTLRDSFILYNMFKTG